MVLFFTAARRLCHLLSEFCWLKRPIKPVPTPAGSERAPSFGVQRRQLSSARRLLLLWKIQRVHLVPEGAPGKLSVPSKPISNRPPDSRGQESRTSGPRGGDAS